MKDTVSRLSAGYAVANGVNPPDNLTLQILNFIIALIGVLTPLVLHFFKKPDNEQSNKKKV